VIALSFSPVAHDGESIGASFLYFALMPTIFAAHKLSTAIPAWAVVTLSAGVNAAVIWVVVDWLISATKMRGIN